MDSLLHIVSEYGLFLGIPLLFLAVVAWIYRPGARKRYEDDGRIPFPSEKADAKPTVQGNASPKSHP